MSPEDTHVELDGSEHQQVLATHGTSFHQASLLLQPEVRQDAALLYHLCRLVDDTADEAPDEASARAGLEALKSELGGASPRPLVRDFLAMAGRRGVSVEAAMELIRGVESDLDQVRVADDGELLRYAYRVAGTVGLMMCGVMGVTEPRALHFAVDLGVAMQLTNICRDVLEDSRMDRVYLPASRLEAAGTSTARLLASQADRQAVREVVVDLLQLAERYYASADLGMRWIPLRSRLAILAASRIYRSIGLRLLRVHGGDSLHGRTVVPNWERALHALGGLGQLLRPTLVGMGPAPAHDAGLHRDLLGLPGCQPEGMTP